MGEPIRQFRPFGIIFVGRGLLRLYSEFKKRFNIRLIRWFGRVNANGSKRIGELLNELEIRVGDAG